MNHHQAENIAIAALQYLSVNESYFDNFLANSGLDASELATAVKTNGFQISILEFICGDESLLLSFCQSSDVEPSEPYKAFQFLSYNN